MIGQRPIHTYKSIHSNYLMLRDENKTLRAELAVRFYPNFTSLRRVTFRPGKIHAREFVASGIDKHPRILRITRHEHCTLELGLSYCIRWSVPLFCDQLTSLSCPFMNQELELLSNACALTTWMTLITTRRHPSIPQNTQPSPLALHPYVFLWLKGDWREVSRNWAKILRD